MPFQEPGIAFLASRYHAANGDEPGLGKTIQAIHAAERISAKNILVTCPASVRTSWLAHVEEHFGHTRGWDIVSYNYTSDEKHRAAMRDKYDVWIGDEIHFCKTPGSKRTQAIFGAGGVARRALFKWCLSGTLVPNGRPVELYPMLASLAPAFAGMSYDAYVRKYCGAFFDGRGLNVKGASRVDELGGLLRDFMIRRTKREVFPGRREPLVSRVAVDLTAADLAAVRAEEDAIGARPARISQRYEDFSQLGDTAKLLRLLGVAMVPRVSQFVDDLLASVDKVVLFAHHLEVIARFADHFTNQGKEYVIYRGGMSDSEKADAVARFQMPGCRVFIAQKNAAGTGINGLQNVCSTAVIAEAPWVPGETEQLIDRLDRIGQQDDIVNAYMMYARGTLSAVVVGVHDRKEAVSERLMGDGLAEGL